MTTWVIRSARVASRAALTIHHICLRALGGKPSQLLRACGSRSSAAVQVRWFLEILDFVRDRPPAVGFRGSNGVATGVGHQATLLHVGCAFTVEPGPGTLGFARRDQLQAALVVEIVLVESTRPPTNFLEIRLEPQRSKAAQRNNTCSFINNRCNLTVCQVVENCCWMPRSACWANGACGP